MFTFSDVQDKLGKYIMKRKSSIGTCPEKKKPWLLNFANQST